jgi:hypothetical protein
MFAPSNSTISLPTPRALSPSTSFTLPYRPAMKALAEQFNGTFKYMLAMFVNDVHAHWARWVPTPTYGRAAVNGVHADGVDDGQKGSHTIRPATRRGQRWRDRLIPWRHLQRVRDIAKAAWECAQESTIRQTLPHPHQTQRGYVS